MNFDLAEPEKAVFINGGNMDNKEIILSKIAEILSRKGFFFKSNLHLNQDLNALDWENFLINMRIT